jgi:hypothetical protein
VPFCRVDEFIVVAVNFRCLRLARMWREMGIVRLTIKIVIQHARGHARNCLPIEILIHQLIRFIQGSRININNAKSFPQAFRPNRLVRNINLPICRIYKIWSIDRVQKRRIDRPNGILERNLGSDRWFWWRRGRSGWFWLCRRDQWNATRLSL